MQIDQQFTDEFKCHVFDIIYKYEKMDIVFDLAIKNNDVEIVKKMLCIFTTDQICGGLDLSCKAGNLDMVKLLIDNATPKYDGFYLYKTCVESAYKNQHNEIAKFIIFNTLDLHKFGSEFLELAIKYHDIDVIKCLLDTDIKLYNIDYIANAVKQNNAEVVKLLLEHPKTRIHNDNRDYINKAISMNNLEIVKLIIEDSRMYPDGIDSPKHLVRSTFHYNNPEMLNYMLLSDKIKILLNMENITKICAKGYVDCIKNIPMYVFENMSMCDMNNILYEVCKKNKGNLWNIYYGFLMLILFIPLLIILL